MMILGGSLESSFLLSGKLEKLKGLRKLKKLKTKMTENWKIKN